MESETEKNGNKRLQDDAIPESKSAEKSKETEGLMKNKPSKPPITIDLKSEQVKSKSSSTSNTKKDSDSTDYKSKAGKSSTSSKLDNKGTEHTGFDSSKTSTSSGAENSKTLNQDKNSENSASQSTVDSNDAKTKSDSRRNLNVEGQNSQWIGGRITSNVVAGAVGGLLVLIIMYGVSLFEQNSTESNARFESIEAINLEDDNRLTALESQTSVIGARLNDFFNESNENSELVKLSTTLAVYEEQLNEYGEKLNSAIEILKDLEGSENTDLGAVQELMESLTLIEEEIEGDKTKIDSIQAQISNQQTTIDQLIEQGEELQNQLVEKADVEIRIFELADRVNIIENEYEKNSPHELALQTITVVALKSAIDRGYPFTVELAAVRSIFPESEDLSKFAKYSETGISTTLDLILSFPEIARKMDAENLKVDEDSGIVSGFLTGIRSLVVIRNSDVDESSDVSSLIFAMKKSVEKADFERALAIYDLLPQNIQQPATEWVESVLIRLEVDKLVKKVTTDVIESMSGSLN